MKHLHGFIAGLGALLPACSLLVDTSATQCTADAECADLVGPDSTCEAGECSMPSSNETGPTGSGDSSSGNETTGPGATTAPADTSGATVTASSEPTTTVDPDSGTSDGGPAVCGDGIISGEDEVCDGEEFGDLSCTSLGFMGGTLVCTAMCQSYDSSGCYNCGNNVIEGAEDCEGEVPAGVSCANQGFTEGEISCSPVTCQYDTSLCSLCGNGVIEGDEPCDGDDLAGMDCAAIGFDMGALACNANCSYDFSGCSGGQYLQDFEAGAIPAEFGLPTAIDWSADNGNPIAGTWSAGSGDIADSGTTTMTLAVTYAIAGTVAFTHEESTESSYDYLEFWIDGALLEDWSGINAPANASYPVAAGAHTFEWRYRKDSSLDGGSDRVWVDDIALTGGVPS
ncbi:MAG: hypothetical protein JNK45_37345 [Myxococcales bacterium]|nr:hypothetical protein [Myxococcales bacterium]